MITLNAPCSHILATGFVLLVANASFAGSVSATRHGNYFLVHWEGDERIEVRLPAQGGLLNQPFTISVDGEPLTFDGFVASMNGQRRQGWEIVSEQASIQSRRVVFEQTLQHPQLQTPTTARFQVWMEPSDKAVRFQIALRGESQHLDHLGVGRCGGQGLATRRLYYGTCVIDGPIEAFDIGMRINTNRYWTWELANGLALMQGMDVAPTGYTYEPGDGSAVFDVHGSCSVPITYRFLVTGLGAQEAFRQYSRSLGHQPTNAVKTLPGRCMIMTWYPLKDHLEWWYREFVGRGARDMIWLSYTNWPDDANRRLADLSNSLYAVYTNFVDYFDPVADEGRRLSPDWSAGNCIYNARGDLVRGYHRSTRLLPNLYTKWANEGHMWDGFYNVREHVDIMGVNAWYFDVHAGTRPHHYFDRQGKHYGQREFFQHTADLFAVARDRGGDAPVFSEFGNEWYAEAMEGGAFMMTSNMMNYGIKGADWEHYPNLDQVHRRWHLPVSAYNHVEWERFRGRERRDYFQSRVQLNVMFGRPELISCYWNDDLSDMSSRLVAWYLHSAFHKMLGNHGIHQIEFDQNSIHRPIIRYDHGAVVWVNPRGDEWLVNGRRLMNLCYLIKGPDFEQYCEIPEGKGERVEFVRSPDYWFFRAPKLHDFGVAKVAGAYAVRLPEPGKLVVHQVEKTSEVIQLHLPTLLGRPGPYQLGRVVNVYPDRRVARYQERYEAVIETGEETLNIHAYETRRSQIDRDWLIFEPVQDPHVWRYEIDIESGPSEDADMPDAAAIRIWPEENHAVWHFSHPAVGTGFFRVMMPEVPGIITPVRWTALDGGKTLKFRWDAPPDQKRLRRDGKGIFGEPCDYWGRIHAGDEEIDYSFTVANTGTESWPEGTEFNICVAPGDDTGFVDPQLERLFVHQDGTWIQAHTFCPTGPAMGAVRTRLSPFVSKTHPRLERLIARLSADSQWVLGNANDHGSFLAWNPVSCMSCLHCAPVVGAVAPGQSVTTRGKIYLFRGKLEHVLERYKSDFGLLNP